MNQDSTISTPVAEQQSGCVVASGWTARWSWLAVAMLFLLTSFLRAPIPAVNEPHYLGKAKHYWDPSWCAGDFFLESSNPHLYFYWVVGWLTRFLSLPATAAVVRVLSLSLLAAGWMAMTRQLYRTAWAGAAAAALFTLQMAWGNFSGEWLLGGAESKVFAYACVLWSGAAWMKGRLLPAALMMSAGVAFHPVVGLWVLIATTLTSLASRAHLRKSSRPTAVTVAARSRDDGRVGESSRTSQSRAQVRAAAVAIVMGTMLGLWPALSLIIGNEPELAREADRILLTQRVGHHTDPVLFPTSAYRDYGAWLVIWLGGLLVVRPRRSLAVVQTFVAAALFIAAVGLLVGWLPTFTSLGWQNPWRLWLLKFYPFRLADLALPCGVALQAIAILESKLLAAAAPAVQRAVWAALTLITTGVALALPAPDANASGMSSSQSADWIAMCRWIASETASTSLLATANEDWAVKWFAHRPEYVNFKDCPQDAAGIVEWWRRRQTLVEWSRQSKSDGSISTADLANLRSRTGIDYLLVSRYGPIDAQPVHQQGPFKLFRLP